MTEADRAVLLEAAAQVQTQLDYLSLPDSFPVYIPYRAFKLVWLATQGQLGPPGLSPLIDELVREEEPDEGLRQRIPARYKDVIKR